MKVDYGNFYDQDYWNGRKMYRTPDGQMNVYHGPSLEWEGFKLITDALAPMLPGKSILDVGCSAGSLAAEFQKRGYDAWGVDISKHAVENCVKSMKEKIALADISKAPDLSSYQGIVARASGMEPKRFPEKYDVVMATDLLEHLYEEDLERTFDWMVGKSNKWLFFCVATCHDPANPPSLNAPQEFVHEKGKDVPLQWEATAAAGHVNVRTWQYWVKLFRRKGLTIRWDLMYLFQLQREFSKPFLATLGWHHGNTWILEKR